ncbi:hypothetical protein O181_004125 [Austropuccinia psidii MF-1]|uniref:Uncharacterized protein n=1 Tax=Austropuccinia psidii MF-1 TaxID=1389203 RepID=A0A9Q3GEK2_9BASI|nr:hypothetical protein [Austropuccinia psidii MF-1]
MYAIAVHNKKYRCLTIGDNKRQEFAFLPFKRQITVSRVAPVNLELERFKSEQLNESEISLKLTDKPLGAIIGHEFDIILDIDRAYPPLLRRPVYPASTKSREALEIHIKELLDLVVIRNVGHNEQVERNKPVIVAWHNGNSRMVGNFSPLNTYTVPDRYPIPKIQIAPTHIPSSVYNHYGCP